MANKSKAAVLPAKPVVLSPQEKVENRIAEFDNSVAAIVDDYLFDPEAKFELEVASEKLKTEMIALLDSDFETLADLMDALPDGQLDTDKFVYLLQKADEENETSSFIENVETCDMVSTLVEKGYVVIELQSLAQREKLQNFIEREIYPLYADQEQYVNI